jgi:fatty-acyl-CoA synthase/O-succinylbenzoic acid--CoA ligase
MNVVEPILFQCRLNPLTPAICTPGSQFESVNYDTLGKLIHNAAQAALKSGIAPGQVVALFVRDTILHAALVFGLMRFGAVTVSLRSPRVPAGINADVILTDAPQLFSDPATILNVDHGWLAGSGAPPDYENIYPGREDDICRIILTSGSTGEAKGMAFSHKTLAARIAHGTYSKGPRHAHCARFFCDLSIGTSPGFRYALSLLSRGATVYFLGDDPADILQALDLHEIQGMATSPFGLGEFLKFFEADGAFESRLDHIICQGAMLSRELSRRARIRMCQNLYSTYGATETNTVAIGPAATTEAIPGAVGYVLPSVTVEAVDGSGNVLAAGREGELRIRSPQMVTGYLGDLETTRKFFRDGYFYSGDIGCVTPDGILIVSGRKKTALNLGGDTVNPERVEDVILAYPGVEEAGVFAVTNDLGIAELCALIVTSASIEETSLQAHCTTKLPRGCVPVRYIAVDTLPRAGQGKIDRQRLPEIAKAKLLSS